MNQRHTREKYPTFLKYLKGGGHSGGAPFLGLLDFTDLHLPERLCQGMPPHDCSTMRAMVTLTGRYANIASINPLRHQLDGMLQIGRRSVSEIASLLEINAEGPRWAFYDALKDADKGETIRFIDGDALGAHFPEYAEVEAVPPEIRITMLLHMFVKYCQEQTDTPSITFIKETQGIFRVTFAT